MLIPLAIFIAVVFMVMGGIFYYSLSCRIEDIEKETEDYGRYWRNAVQDFERRSDALKEEIKDLKQELNYQQLLRGITDGVTTIEGKPEITLRQAIDALCVLLDVRIIGERTEVVALKQKKKKNES